MSSIEFDFDDAHGAHNEYDCEMVTGLDCKKSRTTAIPLKKSRVKPNLTLSLPYDIYHNALLSRSVRSPIQRSPSVSPIN